MKLLSSFTLSALLQRSTTAYAERPAMAFAGESPMSYNDFNLKVNSLSRFLTEIGINKGDKVAILSTNMPHWGISYFAIGTIGAVVVPILPDFHETEIENIIKHAETKAVVVSEALMAKIGNVEPEIVKHIISIENFELIRGERAKFEDGLFDLHTDTPGEDDLLAIIYTSGTTGNSKGVMLSHKNIVYNAIQGANVQEVGTNDRFLSILPLSHTYENTLGLILPLMQGSCIYYLTKPPTPAVLLPALKIVKPTMMLSVPLILEKIYRNKIAKTFTKNIIIKGIYKLPAVRKKLNRIAGKKLLETFGGELKFFGIGGAKLDRTVEKFLIEARFPYAIGYGLTETSPLLAGVNAENTRLQSTGPSVLDVELKINDPDPKTGEGEVWAKGPNIMQGYYKDEEQTQKAFTEDGWFKTGDLASFDKDGFLYIKGRLKNMIVGNSGENIYPEEIESVINNFSHVVESLVVQQKGKLVAMVHFNHEEIEERYKHLKEDVAHYIDHK
ncbi:MAG: AMP-binding protein, partial [Chlorobiales bacterium]|nr:AMP-binding protein [Chlorobiales bacterium]